MKLLFSNENFVRFHMTNISNFNNFGRKKQKMTFSVDSAFEVIKKHGSLGVLVVWLFITNNRLGNVEDKLYECYQDKRLSYSKADKKYMEPRRIYAVLPEKLTKKEDEDNRRHA